VADTWDQSLEAATGDCHLTAARNSSREITIGTSQDEVDLPLPASDLLNLNLLLRRRTVLCPVLREVIEK
jgi:hypothetical protein